MIRAIIFDMDAMIVHGERFSSRLASEYDIPLETTLPFFTGDFQKCLIGELDLKETLPQYLSIWGWQRSLDDLLDVWFDPNHNVIDTRFETLITEIKEAGIKTYLGTNNEKYRSDTLFNRGLRKWFDSIFSSGYIGSKKPDSAFFQHVLKMTKHSKEDILFCDDNIKNIEGAKSFGLSTHTYTDFETFEKLARKIIAEMSLE